MSTPSLRDEADHLPWRAHIGPRGGQAVATQDVFGRERDEAWAQAEKILALTISILPADATEGWDVLDVEPLF